MKRNGAVTSILATAATLALAACQAPASSDDFDVVIMNGRVMDPETEFDSVRNVGIRD